MHYLFISYFFGFLLEDHPIEFQNLVNTWFILMLIVIIVCFVASEITVNYSQVDKLWSLVPIAYSWITVSVFPSPRVAIMAFLVTIWGLRLSYNFYRKGGYDIIPWMGAEDYRWKYLRGLPILKGRIRFGLFNLFFISIYQNIVIFLFSSPLLIASLHKSNPLTFIDVLAAVFMLIFIITEAIADNQQFRFHQEKKSIAAGEFRYKKSLEKGFLSEGLWKCVRHPNFASEQGIWISFYFFSVSASGTVINFTLSGAVLLVLIFTGSTILTESISGKKYPEYTSFQKKNPKFIPRISCLFNQPASV